MIKRIFLFLLMGAMLASCASPKPAKAPDTMALTIPIIDDAVSEVEPRLTPEEFSGLDTSLTYTFTVRNAEIQDALLLLSRQTGASIVPDRDVTGRTTVDLRNRSLRDILVAILKPSGYTVYVENGIIRASRPRLISRTFNVNYMKDKRSSTSTTNAAISDSGSSGATQSAGSQSTGGGPSQQGSVTIQTSGVSDFWREMIKGLEVIIFGDLGGGRTDAGHSRSDKAGRRLIVNELAGVVHVRDYSDNMEHVRGFLDDVERSVKRQVLIQAHILEVSLSNAFSLGIDWGYLRTLDAGASNPTTINMTQGLVPVPPTGVFQFSLTNNKLTALLDAMKEQGQLKMLSSPKVATLNNQKAVIKLATKEVSWFQKTTTYPGAPPVQITDTLPQIDEIGIYLDVTPQVSEKGTITMQIHPSISEKSRTSVSPDGKSTRPVIDVREVDTMIEVRNGQTAVIAGLIVDKIVETRRSVPFLGDIPWLGALFRYTFQETKKTELVILITPYVLTDTTIADLRRKHLERLDKAGRPFLPTPLPH